VFVAPFQFIPVSLLGPLEGLTGVLDLRAELLRLTSELLGFGSKLLALSPESIALLLVPLLVLGAGRVEIGFALLKDLVEAVDLGAGRLEIRTMLLGLLLGRTGALGLLPAEGVEFLPEPIQLRAERGPFPGQVLHCLGRNFSQAGSNRLQLGPNLFELLQRLIMLVLEPAMLRLQLIMLVQKLLALGGEHSVAVPKLLVLGLQALVLGLKLFPGGLEPLILGDEPVALGVRRRQEKVVAGRGRLRLRFGLARGGDDERMIASLAADRLADVLATDAQSVLTARAGHDDPILRGPGLDGRGRPAFVGVQRNRRVPPLFRLERLIALFATDRLADVLPPDLQLSRAVGANGDEMRLGVAHGRIFPCERAGQRPVTP
jgi:hypothetical protein